VFRHNIEGFVVGDEDDLLSKEKFGISITRVCNVATEINVNASLLMAPCSENYRNGISVSAELTGTACLLPEFLFPVKIERD
jgi:hypothetical protein